MFGRKNRVNSDTLVSEEVAREYGHPGDWFVEPYLVTENDGLITEFTFGPLGEPRPVAYVDDASSYEAMKESMPGHAGRGGIRFRADRQDIPSTDQVSTNPAPGSHDLEMPMDTPAFAQPVNRIAVLDGPVTGSDSGYTGQAGIIGQTLPGVAGPVTGDGGGYSSQLAASYFASLAQQYSNEAAASAMVSAV